MYVIYGQMYVKPDQGTETRNVHYPLIYPAIYLLSFSKYKTRGPRYAYEKQRQTEGEMWVEVSGFFFYLLWRKNKVLMQAWKGMHSLNLRQSLKKALVC
jgi:hypothetical protein